MRVSIISDLYFIEINQFLLDVVGELIFLNNNAFAQCWVEEFSLFVESFWLHGKILKTWSRVTRVRVSFGAYSARNVMTVTWRLVSSSSELASVSYRASIEDDSIFIFGEAGCLVALGPLATLLVASVGSTVFRWTPAGGDWLIVGSLGRGITVMGMVRMRHDIGSLVVIIIPMPVAEVISVVAHPSVDTGRVRMVVVWVPVGCLLVLSIHGHSWSACQLLSFRVIL